MNHLIRFYLMKNSFYFLLIALSGIFTQAQAQNFSTRAGEAKFFSHAPLEDIEAINKEVGVLVSTANNTVKVVVKIVGFKFEKSLMQEHFNENYLESPKFPVASFTGSFTDKEIIKLGNPGTIQSIVSGDLTIHGITQKREIPCTLTVGADGKVSVSSEFMVKLEDHKIKIPTAVGQNIAEEVKVSFAGVLEKQP
jgi:hypothetical protein